MLHLDLNVQQGWPSSLQTVAVEFDLDSMKSLLLQTTPTQASFFMQGVKSPGTDFFGF